MTTLINWLLSYLAGRTCQSYCFGTTKCHPYYLSLIAHWDSPAYFCPMNYTLLLTTTCYVDWIDIKSSLYGIKILRRRQAGTNFLKMPRLDKLILQ
jgi:hypothetical protein